MVGGYFVQLNGKKKVDLVIAPRLISTTLGAIATIAAYRSLNSGHIGT